MADELDHYRQLLMDDRREAHALATEARAALAQPKPPSLREQALDALTLLCKGPDATAFVTCRDTIRRALEQLPDNE